MTGAGGCMRELLWQIQEQNKNEELWDVLGYVDISPEYGTVQVGKKEYPYLGNDEYLLALQSEMNVIISAGSSSLRKRIAMKLQKNPCLQFPNLILPGACICPDVQMGKGNIISMDCRISTNVSLGDFVFLNIGASVCHDGVLSDYVTLSPDVRLAGNVVVGAGSEIGIGARAVQGIQIGEETVIGAGSMVIRNLPDACTAVGVPAKIIKRRKEL